MMGCCWNAGTEQPSIVRNLGAMQMGNVESQESQKLQVLIGLAGYQIP
jgi:hypothetical protein